MRGLLIIACSHSPVVPLPCVVVVDLLFSLVFCLIFHLALVVTDYYDYDYGQYGYCNCLLCYPIRKVMDRETRLMKEWNVMNCKLYFLLHGLGGRN